MVPENEMFECSNCEGSGFLPFPADMPCYVCEGTGRVEEEEVNFVQGSFEQHGEPDKEPTVFMEMDGISFLDKEGNKIPFVKAVHIDPDEEEQEPVLKLGYSGEVTIEVPVPKDEFASKGIFGDFMDGIEAAETGRTPIRFLMILEVNELLDLYNDYKQLYELFGDKEYLEYMAGIKKVLKAKTKK